MEPIVLLVVSRDYMRLQIGDRTIRIDGELLLTSGGSVPDYILYESSVEKWEPPHENDPIDVVKKQVVLKAALRELIKAGWTPKTVP